MKTEKPSLRKADCCTPARRGGPGQSKAGETRDYADSRQDMSTRIDIPGGHALLGTKNPVIASDEEGPLRSKKIAPFKMDETQVTNRRLSLIHI